MSGAAAYIAVHSRRPGCFYTPAQIVKRCAYVVVFLTEKVPFVGGFFRVGQRYDFDGLLLLFSGDTILVSQTHDVVLGVILFVDGYVESVVDGENVGLGGFYIESGGNSELLQ